MVQRIGMMPDPTRSDSYIVTRTEGVAGRPAVTVRAADPELGITYDGVWLNGERSYDTYVILNGGIDGMFHSPRRDLADYSFDRHEECGGGHAP
jgi:hypothetical protein